jgi:hypothetical protein
MPLSFFQIGSLARRQHDFCALLAKCLCDLKSKSTRPTRNECGPARKIECFLDASHVLLSFDWWRE